MWFLLGALIGTLKGCLICIRYLRREIAADIGGFGTSNFSSTTWSQPSTSHW